MNTVPDAEFPDPMKYGTSAGELERLGGDLLAALTATVVSATGEKEWSGLTANQRAAQLARLVWSDHLKQDVSIFWYEAKKHAVAGNLKLAGKHYRSWHNLACLQHLGFKAQVSSAVTRQLSSSRAAAEKLSAANLKAIQIFDAAMIILEGRSKSSAPSINDLASRVAKKLSIPKETVRRYLKPIARQAGLTKKKKSAR